MLYLDVDLIVMAEPFHIKNAIRDNAGRLVRVSFIAFFSLALSFLSLLSSLSLSLLSRIRMHHRLGRLQFPSGRDVKLLAACRAPISFTQGNSGWSRGEQIFCKIRRTQALQHRSDANEWGTAIRELHGRRL